MLRSRIDNRPNSSVTDFRRQLSKLQSTAAPTRGSARAMGRPLAPSPLNRPAAGARPGQAPSSNPRQHQHHRQAHVRHGSPKGGRAGVGTAAPEGRPQYRSHGDHSGGHERPAEASSNLARYDGVRYGLRVEGSDTEQMMRNTRTAGRDA